MDDDQNELVPAVRIEENALAERERPEAAIALRSPDEVATEISKVLAVISERLALEAPHPATAKRVRGARTVPRGFVLSLLAAAERRPDLALARFNTTRARDVLQSGDALKLLSEQAAMFLARLNYTYEARWAEVVADALSTFTIASILAEDPKQADLAAEVENLRKQLGRKGKGGRKKKEQKPE